MLVTIIGDGSWCPRTRVCGYAFEAAAPARGFHRHAGSLLGLQTNPTYPELAALVYGLERAAGRGLVERHDKVLLRSDCTGALHAVNALMHCDPKFLTLTMRLARVKHALDLTIATEHVPGHKPGSPNRWCDEAAREAMARARGKLLRAWTAQQLLFKSEVVS